jgi:hypothetical protein
MVRRYCLVKNKKSKKSKKVSRASKARVSQKTLISEGFEIDGELQAQRDFETEQRYNGLRDVLRTWKMPRFRKLAKSAVVYLRTLSATMDALRSEHAWLSK